MDVEGTPEAFERVFAIQINGYKLGENAEYSNDRDPVIPAHLAAIVHSVGGLNSIQRVHAAHDRMVAPKSPGDRSSMLTPLHADGDRAAYQEALKAAAARRAETSSVLKGAIGAENKSFGSSTQHHQRLPGPDRHLQLLRV